MKQRENNIFKFYFCISGPFRHIWAVRPNDRLHFLSNVQYRLQLPDAEHQHQLTRGRDDAEGLEKIVREAEQQLSPASLCWLRYRVPALHPSLLSHHPHHTQDILQPLGELVRKLPREITSIEPTTSHAGQVRRLRIY